MHCQGLQPKGWAELKQVASYTHHVHGCTFSSDWRKQLVAAKALELRVQKLEGYSTVPRGTLARVGQGWLVVAKPHTPHSKREHNAHGETCSMVDACFTCTMGTTEHGVDSHKVHAIFISFRDGRRHRVNRSLAVDPWRALCDDSNKLDEEEKVEFHDEICMRTWM